MAKNIIIMKVKSLLMIGLFLLTGSCENIDYSFDSSIYAGTYDVTCSCEGRRNGSAFSETVNRTGVVNIIEGNKATLKGFGAEFEIRLSENGLFKFSNLCRDSYYSNCEYEREGTGWIKNRKMTLNYDYSSILNSINITCSCLPRI